MKSIALMLMLGLAGCAGGGAVVWDKAGATQRDFDIDIGQCRAQAWSITNAGAAQLLMVQNSCMQGKGWYQSRS